MAVKTEKSQMVWLIQSALHYAPLILVGSLLGCLLALIVGTTMLEVTFSASFAIAFGMILEAIAVIIVFRAITTEGDESSKITRSIVIGFATCIAIGGLLCILLDKSLMIKYSAMLKIPMYTLLGATISFAITYSLLDLAGLGLFSCGCLHRSYRVRSLLAYPLQIYVLSVTTFIMGALFGLLFGVLKVGNEEPWRTHTRLIEQQLMSLPVAAILGSVILVVNAHIAEQNKESNYFDPFSNTDGI